MGKAEITLQVNGHQHDLRVAVKQRLLDVLLDELGLVGTREECGVGLCGACTVLIDGRPISSCLLTAIRAQ